MKTIRKIKQNGPHEYPQGKELEKLPLIYAYLKKEKYSSLGPLNILLKCWGWIHSKYTEPLRTEALSPQNHMQNLLYIDMFLESMFN